MNEYKINTHTESVIVEPGTYKIPIFDQNNVPYTIVNHNANSMGACFWFSVLYFLNIDKMTFVKRLIYGLTDDDCKPSQNFEPSIIGLHPDATDLRLCGLAIINSLLYEQHSLTYGLMSIPIILRIFHEIRSITIICVQESADGQWEHGVSKAKCIATRYPVNLDGSNDGINIVLLQAHSLHTTCGHIMSVIVDQNISDLLLFDERENVKRYPNILMTRFM